MPSIAWVSVVVTLGIFVTTHIVVTVWWASRVNTLLDIVQKNLGELVAELKSVDAKYFTREEAARELAIAEKEHKALWRKIDELKDEARKGENHG